MQKYRNRKSIRLKRYDYSSPGYYFITICVKDRKRVLGKIKNGKIILFQIGKIANECWRSIPFHFKNVVLGYFIIMPDHIHGILIIENADMISAMIVGNADLHSLQSQYSYNQYRTKMHLPKIIHGFKSSTTREIHRQLNGVDFAWQKSYYDRIIRNQNKYARFQQYILDNLVKWELKMRMR